MNRSTTPKTAIVYFHADDYGITKAQTDTILACHHNGVLNSVSVMPNSDYLSESLDRLSDTGIRKVCHLNFIEGKSLTPASNCPLLVDQAGHFRCSFGYLLKLNYGFPDKRRHLKQQLHREIAAQIAAVFPNESLISVDSHQHFLMIPVVFEAFMDVVSENHYQLSEIRIPVDPFRPLLTTPSVWSKLRPVDLIKWCVLAFLSIGKKKHLFLQGANIPTFFGIFFTCHMEYDIVSSLLPKYLRIAERKGTGLELMFHPGGIKDTMSLLDASQQDLVAFYQSNDRNKEADALLSLSGVTL